MTRSLLLGLRILVVEDDAIIALDIAGTLADAGATVIGPVYRVARALDLLETSAIDIAVLDYRLESETISPVADRLSTQGISASKTAPPGERGCRSRHQVERQEIPREQTSLPLQ